MRSEGRSSITTGCEIFAALMKQERTAAELVFATGFQRPAVERWLNEMRLSGVVYRKKPGGLANQRGRRPVVYCLQPSPFERADLAQTTTRSKQ